MNNYYRNLQELKDDIITIKGLVEKQLCSGPTHHPICQELTKLFHKVEGSEKELRKQLMRQGKRAFSKTSVTKFIKKILGDKNA